MIQVRHIYCASPFVYLCCYISSTSDHEALDPRGWGRLLQKLVQGVKDLEMSLISRFVFLFFPFLKSVTISFVLCLGFFALKAYWIPAPALEGKVLTFAPPGKSVVSRFL